MAWWSGLPERLAGWAASRPHVLPVVCPGATEVRLEAEAVVAALGGRLVPTPADADVLLVIGEPSAELRAAADEVWAQLPGPRVRGQVVRPGQVGEVLRGLLPALADRRQVAEAAGRDDAWQPSGTDMPGGLPMADRGEDRDGLKLDVLRVPLGPVLPHWPAGLVIDTLLQGDVVQRAHGRVLASAGTGGPPYWRSGREAAMGDRRRAACHLDSLGRLLAVAGWASAAHSAGRLRDRLLAGEPQARVRRGFLAWRRRVERSRPLRWATDGLGVLDAGHAARLGVDGPAARAGPPYDATARWRQWLAETDRLLAGEPAPEDGGPRGRPDRGAPPSRGLLAAAVELMPGLDLTAARLLVASFDPDTDELAPGEGVR
ncbi:hypothetical protein [Streptomyces gobiensis]|uniref:hypothetical protein n=1 Tax=Streptomyces gobiensis TaxID=2875706 RepID=UPI001E532FEE|nr:hypothetical protein [Streptomyces gobiensis]UGY93629.1 hypothetical protein test1122_19170 [Streptomyces gobiensis]